MNIRFRKYKCPAPRDHKYEGCMFSWYPDEKNPRGCMYCGKTIKETETIWRKIYHIYLGIVPYDWRPKNMWYSFKCWAFKRYTTVKSRKLNHGWCDRKALIIHQVFEVLCQFVEEECPKTPQEWQWQKKHNPDFYDAWKEAKELREWWLNVYDESYPFNLTEVERAKLVKKSKKSAAQLSIDFEAETINKCKRAIEISPFFWT